METEFAEPCPMHLIYTCRLCDYAIATDNNTEAECWSALCTHQETEHPSDLDWEGGESTTSEVDGDEH
jgi:hypothetical protein